MNKNSERLKALDVFRGITIAGMVLVNNPGTWSSVYPPLEHSQWNGCTPTDLIFPFFLFIVGVSITFSLSKRKERGDSHKSLILQIVKRGLILFALGIFLNGFPEFNLSTLRIPGVLQRIAIVYVVASFLYLKLNFKGQLIFSLAVLIFYWGIMTLIPVPGHGQANLEPGTNLSAWLDRFVLGNHIWSQSKTWDPEGILSTLPSIVTAFIGVFTGQLLKNEVSKESKALLMYVAGTFLILGGYLLDFYFPINKNLWSSSYVLYTGGLALLFLSTCYWLLDIKNIVKWSKPFEVFGLNAIALYFLSQLTAIFLYIITFQSGGETVTLQDYLFNNLFFTWLGPLNASLLWAVFYVLFFLGIMWIFYKKKIFIKI